MERNVVLGGAMGLPDAQADVLRAALLLGLLLAVARRPVAFPLARCASDAWAGVLPDAIADELRALPDAAEISVDRARDVPAPDARKAVPAPAFQ